MKCPIPTERTKRSFGNEPGFVYGYTVHVSNDGTHYGDGEDIYIYNSECQSPVWSGEHVDFVMTVSSVTIFISAYYDG